MEESLRVIVQEAWSKSIDPKEVVIDCINKGLVQDYECLIFKHAVVEAYEHYDYVHECFRKKLVW